MDKQTSLLFIEKAIEKTKSNQLNWKILEDYSVPKSVSENYFLNPDNMNGYTVIGPGCFVSEYKSGLLLFFTFAPDTCMNPPHGCGFSLRIQDDISEYSVEIARTNKDTDINSQLIRLYNLIDDKISNHGSQILGDTGQTAALLVRDFLNS